MIPAKIFSLAIITSIACNSIDNRKIQNSEVIGCFNTITSDTSWYTSGIKAPKFKGLDNIYFGITTNNEEAQYYFNQGLMLAYGFNHAEAARSFYEATKQDTGCAMAYWGYAYVLGPNYNGGMEKDNYLRAYEAAQKAASLAESCTDREKALIHAIAFRYSSDTANDRSELDKAYSAAMKKAYQQFPADSDIATLYAESLMNLHPWDLYDKQTKQPKAWTPELVRILETVISNNATHPGAQHFYIHVMEASATPEKALASAGVLDTLVQGAGHLLHMPSHIYINTGDYHLGTISNLRAIEADSLYTTQCHAQGIYPLSYYPHNYHFLTATAALEGHAALAWEASLALQNTIAKDIMHLPEWGTLQHYYTIPYYVAVKLALWDTIALLAPPPEELVYPQAVWHYARGMMYLGKADISNAGHELQRLKFLSEDTLLQHLTIWGINTTADLVQIAVKVLEAGIEAKKQNFNSSISLLKQAVIIEDNLNYNEPPDWFFSVRHHLGAILLKAGKYKEAEKIYKEDLLTWKKNGWALKGLYNSLVLQNRKQEAEGIKAEFENSWQYADMIINSSSVVFN
jgi:hypothetical protein